MNRISRLKYTGVIAGVGLAVVVFSSGVYANTDLKETEEETEIEVFSLDLSENVSANSLDWNIQSMPEEIDDQKEPENDAALSAGAGDVLVDVETDTEDDTESSGSDNMPEATEDLSLIHI